MLKLSNSPDGLEIASVYPCLNILESREDGFIEFYSEGHIMSSDKITIDTSKNQPCIYACMREGLSVDITWEDGSVRRYDLIFSDQCAHVLIGLGDLNIKSIQILGLDKMEGVEVTE